ncbi:MAG: hypothetical protein ACQEXJ_10780 [Myxococcota bacterium]
MRRAHSLGIVGAAPRSVRGPVRATSFRVFQRLVGELEAAPYLAGHAACHALMNGVERVLFAGVGDPDDAEDVDSAVRRLLATDEVTCLVAPDVTEPAVLRRVVETWATADVDPGCLWLDAPEGATPEEVVEWRADLGGDPERVRVATPWIPTHSPGTRAVETLPPSCLVPALHLGSATTLRGVHDAPGPPPTDDVERLRDAGCGLLVPRGRRREVALAFPPPLPTDRAPTPPPDPVAEAVREATRDLALTAPNGPALWSSLERSARGALERLRRRGVLSTFHVRCDQETHEGHPDAPVLEVRVRYPRRVHEIVIRVEPSEPSP